MSRVGTALASAATWAERVRPRWTVTVLAIAVVGALLGYLDVHNSVVTRVVFVALVACFYIFPWLVAIVRSFAEGYRGREHPA